MKNQMWSGRFNTASDTLLKEFNASLNVDKELFKQDIKGSIAHATMLESRGILKKDELDTTLKGLKQIESEIQNNDFIFNIDDEDIHMAVEKRLSEIIGRETGGKLHTARSRNDQVATDFKLSVKEKTGELMLLLKELIITLVAHAKEHRESIMPSFTHLQHAQPISFSLWILSYAFMLKRDVLRLENTLELADECPFGSYACAGISYPTNRALSAKMLGFKEAMQNAMDGVSDRDFALDLLYNISMIFTHTSRLCEEFTLFSSTEFNSISISDSFSTGSPIMPQRKNPDVCELIRGKTGRAYGDLIVLFTMVKALPLIHNKDMQEDKEGIFNSAKTAQNSLIILNAMLKEIRIKKENVPKVCKNGHLLATDSADYLVRKKNIPFREAHFTVGKVVAYAKNEGTDLNEISNLAQIDSIFDEEAIQIPDFKHSLNAKRSQGSNSISSVERQIQNLEDFSKAKSL